MNVLTMQGVRKSFGSLEVLKGISLTVGEGEAVSVIGPSGSGKSTLLRCATLLETMDGGSLAYGNDFAATMDAEGKSVYADKAALRRIKSRFGLVFQQFNLFPHYTVLKNVTDAPLTVQRRERGEVRELALSLLEKMGLADKADAYPCQLSGGQQQRVAIARALVNEPEVLLLDEPLGALDLKLRKEMQIELKRMQKKLGITFIFVTHDQEEALTMSDTIAVMNHGIIQQIGCPTDVYNEPKNRFVARFIGESNIFEATMRRDYLVNIHGIDYECVDAGFGTEQPVDVVIRPEDVDFVPIGKTPLHGVVTSVLFMGVHYEFTVDCDGRIFKVHSTDFVPVGETVGIEVLPDAIHIMNPERKQPTEAAAEEPQQNL